MPLLYDWYETPQSHDKPQEEKVYYPRVCLRQRRTTDHLCNLIEKMTTASRADIKLVLAALSDVLGMELCAGNQVHLDGLGYFNISLAAIEPVYATTKNKAYKVRVGGVQFLPDKELRRSIGNVEMTRLKAMHSRKVTDEEVDERLTAHFAQQQYMTSREFQSLCHLTRTTANRLLLQLRTDGKLLTRGPRNHPIYVPAPGYYGAPSVEEADTETATSSM